jgi:hypothetical protein
MRNAFQLTCGHDQWTYGLAQVVFQSSQGLFRAEKLKYMYVHQTVLVTHDFGRHDDVLMMVYSGSS